jgi:Sec-independent protein secretion pathway component TatC
VRHIKPASPEAPGVDPISMLLETALLILLYELSIVLARAFGQPGERFEDAPQAP